MPKIHIDKSIFIKAKPEKVYNIVNDFHNWKPWSPWLITDPDTKLNIKEDGKYYEWEGDVTGVGNMTVLNENENSLIEYGLTFLKPWKSKAKVAFKLIEKEDGVMVHWLMDSSLPWFMFWMKKMMQVFVGMDYSRGLNMLKEYAEDDKVHSELTFKGAVTHKGGTYISITTECALDAIGNKMEEDYTKLMEYMMTSHKDKVGGYAFSIYHKWNPVKNYTKYTACIPVNEVPKDLPSGVEVGELKDFRADVVHHKGPYTNVGNAWSAQYTRARAKVFKQNKRKDPLEVYLNSPKDTAPNELESEIVFPIV